MSSSKMVRLAHTSNREQKFHPGNFAAAWSKDFWSLSSPDAKSMDCFWWMAVLMSTMENKSEMTPSIAM